MKKILIFLVSIGSLSMAFANSDHNAQIQADNVKAEAKDSYAINKSKPTVGAELPIAPVGSAQKAAAPSTGKLGTELPIAPVGGTQDNISK